MPILWLVFGTIAADLAPLIEGVLVGLLLVGIVGAACALRFELTHRAGE